MTLSATLKSSKNCCNGLYLKMDSKYLLKVRIVNVEGLKFELR